MYLNMDYYKPFKSSLICVIRQGRLQKARKLIDYYGLSYSPAWLGGYLLLCYALERKHVSIAKLLLTRGSRVNNEKKKPSNTPLHFAVMIRRNGNIEIVEMLLDKGVNIDAKNEDGKTPLHNAIEYENIEVIELLLKHRADVNATDNDGTSPLHFAAKNASITENLLNHGACIHSLTLNEGYTPLHFAAELGNEETVKLLLNRGADINASTKDNLTPLYIATKEGHKTVVNLLLQYGAEVDNKDKDGKTLLHLAVEKGYLTIVRNVLKYCPDINNKSNRNSLKIAVCGFGKKYKKIVEALLEYGFIVNPKDANNPKLLQASVENGYLKIIDDLLKYGADVNSTFEEGFTLLHRAIKKKQEKVAKLLISYGADINAQDKVRKTPIYYAIKNADLKITKLLLTNGANIKDSPRLLNIAVEKECIEIVKALLQHDADINASDNYGRTALHFTAMSKSKVTSRIPIIPVQNISENTNEDIKEEIAELLLSKGVNVDAQTKAGETTLHAAVGKGYAKVVKTLLKYNANVNSKTKIGVTPLFLSSIRIKNEEISLMLLNKGANVNDRQMFGECTLLHLAILEGNGGIIKLLLEWGAKVNSKLIDDITPLHLGAQKGFPEITENLLKFGADINITCRNNLTPLDLAMDRLRFFCERLRFNPQSLSLHFNAYRYQLTINILMRHIVKMKTANLYVSEKNVRPVITGDLSVFQDKCEKEIARMKSEKISNTNVSIYDTLVKDTSLVAIYMRNENIVQVLKSNDYKTTFPLYAGMIENNFKKAMERKKLLEQGNSIIHYFFSNFHELPYICRDKIFSYLSVKDLRLLIHTCKPLCISDPSTNVSDVVKKE